MNKIIKLLFVFNFVLCSHLNSQNTVGTIKIESGVYEGYTLFSANTKSFLIDNCGQIINEWTSNYFPGNAVYLLPNGNLLRTGKEHGKSNIAFGGVGGIVELFNWEGVLIWSHSFNNDQARQHHDAYPMPNGNILVLIAESWSKADVIAAGKDATKMTDDRLYNEQIIEVKPIGSDNYELVWEWNVKDHLIQDFDATKNNFGIVENNPQRLDINFFNGFGEDADWLHVNSIQYNSKFDQIIISPRNLSEFWIIDHSTTIEESKSSSGGVFGKGGDFLYRWGNSQSYKIGNESDRVLFGQHSPNFIIENGDYTNDIIVFNNGIKRSPSYSEILKIKLPVSESGFYSYTSGAKFLPENEFYNYTDLTETPSEFYSPILSSAQVLPNNNILICEGASGNFFEINKNKEVVWQYINPVSVKPFEVVIDQGEEAISNSSFRAHKYSLDYTAFEGKNLSGTQTIENGSDITACKATLSLSNFTNNEFKIFPNPTKNGQIFFKRDVNFDKIEIYNVLGKSVLNLNKSTSEINLSHLEKGVYFVKIYISNKITTRKIIYN